MSEFDNYIQDTYGTSAADMAASEGQAAVDRLRAVYEAGHETGRQAGWSKGYLKGREPGQAEETRPTRDELVAFAQSIAAARPGEDDEPSSEDQEYLTWAADDADRLLAGETQPDLSTIIITPEQLAAAANWACTGPDMAVVTLSTDNRLLRVRQGDDETAFAADGTEQDEEEGEVDELHHTGKHEIDAENEELADKEDDHDA